MIALTSRVITEFESVSGGGLLWIFAGTSLYLLKPPVVRLRRHMRCVMRILILGLRRLHGFVFGQYLHWELKVI